MAKSLLYVGFSVAVVLATLAVGLPAVDAEDVSSDEKLHWLSSLLKLQDEDDAMMVEVGAPFQPQQYGQEEETGKHRWVDFIISPLSDELYVMNPNQTDKTLMGPLGANVTNRTGKSASWQLAQWNTPNMIDGHTDQPIPKDCPANSDWGAATASARVCKGTDNVSGREMNVYTVGSTGTHGLACGKEYDMFLSPIRGVGIIKKDVHEHNLANFSRIECSFDLEVRYSSVEHRCGGTPSECGPHPDYSYMTVGLPLNNPISGETNFFQLLLWDTRWKACGVSNDPCEPGPVNGSWYFRTLPELGVSFHMGDFAHQPCMHHATNVSLSANKTHFHVDVLPQMKAAVRYAADAFGADGDLSHWQVGSLYIGAGLQGSATITYSIADVRLGAVLHE